MHQINPGHTPSPLPFSPILKEFGFRRQVKRVKTKAMNNSRFPCESDQVIIV